MLSAHGLTLMVSLPPLMRPDVGTMFWTVVTFVALLIVLGRFAWRPLLDALDKREKTIQDSLDSATALKRDAEALFEEHQSKIAAAGQEVKAIVDDGRKLADSAREEILGKARIESKVLVDRATKEIELAQDRALDEIRREAVDLSIALASKVIDRSLDKSDHEKFIRDAIKDVKL